MSTWLHCPEPEAHEMHGWAGRRVTFEEVDGTSFSSQDAHTCPGVKEGIQLTLMLERVHEAERALAAAKGDLIAVSIQHRRSIPEASNEVPDVPVA